MFRLFFSPSYYCENYSRTQGKDWLRNELIISLRFWLDLFAASFVKKPRDSAAIPTFFALLATKISNPKFLILLISHSLALLFA